MSIYIIKIDIMSLNFDEIRCYYDDEINDHLTALCDEKQFINVASTIYPLLPKDVLREKLKSFRTTLDFQKEFIYPFLQYIEANLTIGISLVGVENIDKETPYLYVSNHRDIILDSALLCAKFIENGMSTVEIAIGDNLLIFPWIEKLVRVNKSFIVRRGLSVRQVLESSKLLSAYIAHTIADKKQSIWVAQREGRAKDSNDRTQESLLKMFNMYGSDSFFSNLRALNICPLAISYEYDPCDYLKAKEFQQKRDNPEFKKSPYDDLINMKTGVMGYKGKVTYVTCGDINAALDAFGSQDIARNEQVGVVARHIDKQIHANYCIYNVNKIAYDLLLGENRFSTDYTMIEKLDFEKYLAKQIEKIDLENKDIDFLMRKILEMYANPLINHLEAIK